jgi:hypothetical protein
LSLRSMGYDLWLIGESQRYTRSSFKRFAFVGLHWSIYGALREVGRIERTLFMLEWMQDPELRKRVPRERVYDLSTVRQPDSELAVVSVDSFPTPTIIARAGPSTRKKFFEFFTVPIRNANTRAAYYRAIQQFLAWAERAGYQDLEDIEPITVAAYVEMGG